MTIQILSPLFPAEDHLTCSLLTIGPGRELYTWFGHTGILIENQKGEGRFYDFGNFSFKSDHFYRNFAMGRLVYRKMGMSSRNYMSHITSSGQAVILQKLNLPQKEIRQMQKELDENIREGNNTYLYHHYLDNCATRPRDILDKALHGTLKQHTAQGTKESFRSSFRRYSAPYFFADTLLSFLQGRSIDKNITRWDSLFLPDKLMDALDTMTSPEGGPLVEEKVLLKEGAAGLPKPFKTAPSNALKALVTGLAAGIVLLLLQFRSEGTKKDSKPAGITFFMFMLGISLLGLIFYFLSFVSNHVVAHGNINALIVHPFYLIPGLMLLKERRMGLLWFWQVQSAAALLMILLNLLFIHQDNLRISLIMLPLILIPGLGLKIQTIKRDFIRGRPKYISMY